MKGSVRIARIGGVPLRVHWSFPLLVLLVVATYAPRGASAVGQGLLWLVAIFISVTLHELAHSLVARHRGLKVRDIVLLPIGGVSEIPGVQSDPGDEVVIAAAGPAASLAIAGVLAVVGAVAHQVLWPPTLFEGSWVARLLWANVLLGAFNLVPGLPLDGGRVLQGMLARRYGQVRATVVTARIARVAGVVMIAVGLLFNFWLAIIAVFILLAAVGEERATLMRHRLASWRVRELMVPQPPVQASRSAGEVRAAHPGSAQRAVVVVDGPRYLGMVTLEELASALPTNPVAAIADTQAPLLDEDMALFPEATAAFERSQRRCLGVARGGQVTGVLYTHDIDRLAERLNAMAKASPG